MGHCLPRYFKELQKWKLFCVQISEKFSFFINCTTPFNVIPKELKELKNVFNECLYGKYCYINIHRVLPQYHEISFQVYLPRRCWIRKHFVIFLWTVFKATPILFLGSWLHKAFAVGWKGACFEAWLFDLSKFSPN